MANEFKVKNGLIVDAGGIQATGGITGSISATNGLVSGSSQLTTLLPAGIVSGSAQTILNLPTGTVSGSSQIVGSSITTNAITIAGTSTALGGAITAEQIRTAIGTVVSGSSQIVGSAITTNAITIAGTSTALGGAITAEQIRTAIGTVVTGSGQINFTQLSGISSGIVSSSAQVTPLLPTGTVSGSSQVTLSSTTGYGTVINQNVLTTSNVQHNSLGIGMAATGTAGRIDASGDIVAFSTSDINFKENIIPIPNALEKISKISGNTYDWKADMKEYHGFEGNDIGVIAQEIEEILPQLVTTRENGYKAVKYDKLVALLIEGIKEQQIQIQELKTQIGSK